MASEDGSRTGSNASKSGWAKCWVDVNMSVLLSVFPSAVKVPLSACFMRASVRSALDSRPGMIGNCVKKMLATRVNRSTLAAYTAAGFWGDETIYQLAAHRRERSK
jgi:hypothetical protein